MIKGITKVLLAAGILGAGAYGLAAVGAMPQEAYSRGLGFVVALQEGSGPFDGTWVAHADADIAETDEAFCGTATGQFVVQGSRMYGSVENEFGDTFMVTANVDGGGDMSGGMALGIENVAHFTGTLLDSNGVGTWSDELGCYGDVTFQRITAVGSHDPRYIREIAGRAFVVRGIRTIPAAPGLVLHPGDVVAVEESSQVILAIGSDVLRISEKTKFEIPAEETDVQESTVTDRIWTSLKYLIQGPSFEIKTPTAVAGVRG